MPFVTINVLEGKGKDYIKKVSDSVNEAVIETMAFPDDDRYQVVNQLSEDCMQYQARGKNYDASCYAVWTSK